MSETFNSFIIRILLQIFSGTLLESTRISYIRYEEYEFYAD